MRSVVFNVDPNPSIRMVYAILETVQVSSDGYVAVADSDLARAF